MINFRKFINPVQARRKRYKKICELVNLQPNHKILDVGCGLGLSFETFNMKNKIVGLDIYPRQKIFRNNFNYIMGDGENMTFFRNKEFDLVVCIGVLEHIFPFKKLKRIAKEIQRVGKLYVVVVPHMYTIIEPHYQLPLWQFYPNHLKAFLIKHSNIGWYPKNPQGEFIQLNYFKKEKWLSLFPSASVVSYNHIFFGLIRNYIIFKN